MHRTSLLTTPGHFGPVLLPFRYVKMMTKNVISQTNLAKSKYSLNSKANPNPQKRKHYQTSSSYLDSYQFPDQQGGRQQRPPKPQNPPRGQQQFGSNNNQQFGGFNSGNSRFGTSSSHVFPNSVSTNIQFFFHEILMVYFSTKVLYMSFDKVLLAVESLDLSQADKSIIRVSSFPNEWNKFTNIPKKHYLVLGNLPKLMFWSILSFKKLQHWKVNIFQ